VAKLTTTTYAILGLLERRPWSAYELTKYMQLSAIQGVWPRTESRIYLEFKNLVSNELATSEQETAKKRKRTVYTITPEGREALRNWLESAEGSLRLESEPLLKLLFADLHKPALDIQLTHMRLQLIDEVKTMQQSIDRALAEGFFFEENSAATAHLVTLLNKLLDARTSWIVEASKATQQLTTQPGDAEAAREIYRAESRKLAKLLGRLKT
jgi:DNA-binding PadR family transcriptional regulator